MNSKTPHKPKHLFVVKEHKLATGARMLSAENLSKDQKQNIDDMVKRSRSPGVVVGALVTEHAWDVRPLLLQDGVVSMLRYCDPKLAFERNKFQYIKSLQERLAQQSLGNCLLAHGEVDGQIWIRRRYFQNTLDDGGVEWLPYHPLQFAQRLIKAVQVLHQAHIVHGHITFSNVAFDERGPLILDHGMLLAALPIHKEVSDIAPELNGTPNPTPSTDIYGLGAVLRGLVEADVGPAQKQVLEAMLNSEPSARPTISAVVESFFPQEAKAPSSPVSNLPRGGVASGKVITPSSGRANPPPPAPVPEQSKTDSGNVGQPTLGAPKIISPAATKPSSASRAARSAPAEAKVKYVDKPAPLPTPEEALASVTATATDLPSRVRRSSLAPAILAAVVASALVFYHFGLFDRMLGRNEGSAIPYAGYWQSNQPSLMQQVAAAALDADIDAQLVIVGDVLKGNARPLVRANLIRSAFNPLWERELTANDRQIILQLALSKLLSTPHALPEFSTAHPAVLFALASDLPDLEQEQGLKEFATVPLERLAALPNPYGLLFKQLGQLGVASLSELPARAMCHLLTGDSSEVAVSAFLSSADKKVVILAKLAMLLSLMERAPKLAGAIHSSLSTRATAVLELVQWFDAEDLADWKSVEKADLFALMVGALPKTNLTPQQWADLLKFPDKKVRENAVTSISKEFANSSYAATFAFLGSTSNKLTRFQTITLVSAFKNSGELGYSLLAKLLDTGPDAQSILKLLLARSVFGKADAFSLDLARYLKKQSWNASLDELKKLASHPEHYARVLAYSRLDPSKPDELAILTNAAVVEPNEGTRQLIKQKIETEMGVPAESQEPPPAATDDQRPTENF